MRFRMFDLGVSVSARPSSPFPLPNNVLAVNFLQDLYSPACIDTESCKARQHAYNTDRPPKLAGQGGGEPFQDPRTAYARCTTTKRFAILRCRKCINKRCSLSAVIASFITIQDHPSITKKEGGVIKYAPAPTETIDPFPLAFRHIGWSFRHRRRLSCFAKSRSIGSTRIRGRRIRIYSRSLHPRRRQR